MCAGSKTGQKIDRVLVNLGEGGTFTLKNISMSFFGTLFWHLGPYHFLTWKMSWGWLHHHGRVSKFFKVVLFYLTVNSNPIIQIRLRLRSKAFLIELSYGSGLFEKMLKVTNPLNPNPMSQVKVKSQQFWTWPINNRGGTGETKLKNRTRKLGIFKTLKYFKIWNPKNKLEKNYHRQCWIHS